jgi:Ca2+-binding RTX toxin-like protein
MQLARRGENVTLFVRDIDGFHPEEAMLPFDLQPLEPRRLLSGAGLSRTGVLNVVGTIKNDTIFLTVTPDDVRTLAVSVNGRVFKFRTSSVKQVRVSGGTGNDLISYDKYARNVNYLDALSPIFGGAGNDTIVGGGGESRIYAGAGNDNVTGSLRRDIVYAEAGNDTVDGGDGRDYIRGGAGNDLIIGGLASDRLYGDAGDDSFVTSNDIPAVTDFRPFENPQTFDLVDGGAGAHDRADADPVDRLIDVEGTFQS